MLHNACSEKTAKPLENSELREYGMNLNITGNF